MWRVWLPALLLLILGVGGGEWRRRCGAANEAAAGDALAAVAEAEDLLRGKDPDRNGIWDFWTLDLQGLARWGGLRAEIAAADASLAEPVPWRGYLFRALEIDGEGQPYATDTAGRGGPRAYHHSAYAFCAYPARYGWSGSATFLVTEARQVFRLQTRGKPLLACPPEYFVVGLPWQWEK